MESTKRVSRKGASCPSGSMYTNTVHCTVEIVKRFKAKKRWEEGERERGGEFPSAAREKERMRPADWTAGGSNTLTCCVYLLYILWQTWWRRYETNTGREAGVLLRKWACKPAVSPKTEKQREREGGRFSGSTEEQLVSLLYCSKEKV